MNVVFIVKKSNGERGARGQASERPEVRVEVECGTLASGLEVSENGQRVSLLTDTMSTAPFN